jgi:hypothetical protein
MIRRLPEERIPSALPFLISDFGLRIDWAFDVGRWAFSDLRWPCSVPVCTLLVGVRDFEDARFIEGFA